MKRDLTGKEQVLMALAVFALVFGAGIALAPPSLPTASNVGIAIDTNGVVTGPQTIFFGTNLSTGRSVIGPRGGIGVGTTSAPGAGNLTATGTVAAAAFAGDGSGVTNLNALRVVSTNGVIISGAVTQVDIVGPFVLSNSNGRITITAPNVLTNGASPTFAGLTSTGAYPRVTLTGTNGNNTELASDNNTSDNLTNWVGLNYFASGGTNQADFNRFNQFVLTNNLNTNLTMWLTNGAPGKMGRIKILGPTNGNNYTFTLLSANSWWMEWDRNCPTNGATTFTVTNNQSVEVSVVFDKTPTNPIVSLVYSRKTL